jgi:hypothetical protein
MRPDRLLATLTDMAAGKNTKTTAGEVLPAVYDEVLPTAQVWSTFAQASAHGDALIAPSELLPPLP